MGGEQDTKPKELPFVARFAQNLSSTASNLDECVPNLSPLS